MAKLDIKYEENKTKGLQQSQRLITLYFWHISALR